MQDRPSTDETYHLQLLTSHTKIPSYYNNLRYHKNVVILYPDPDHNDANEDYPEVRRFKACYIIQDELLRNDKHKYIEVAMGNLSREEVTYAAARIYQALNLAKNLQIIKDINLRVLAEAAKAEEIKRRQQEIDDAVIFEIVARDVAQLDEIFKLKTTEHKIEAADTNKTDVEMNHPSQLEEVSTHIPIPITELRQFIFSLTKNETETSYDFPNMPATDSKDAQLTFFGSPRLDLPHTLGTLILRGEENDVETVLAHVKENPALLDVVVTVKDPLGTPVTGTLLQLAAMAGDVNLKSDITNEKDRGLVERLADAGGLSKERVAEDLACITSKEAQDANDKRVERYLAIIKKFGNSLCEGKITDDEAIAQLEKELLEERSKAVNAGFVFDPKILHDTAKWFEENVNRFGDWWTPQSDAFWINGFGKLQSLLSSRDAQVVRTGISKVVDDSVMAERTLKNPSGDSHFYNASSKLGRDFYLGYYGAQCGQASWRVAPRARTRFAVQNLCRAKTTALHSLCCVHASVHANNEWF